MPVTLLDRLPLPNLKVYTSGSVLLLSVAVYYALSVTSDPNWRVNATLQRQEAMGNSGEEVKMVLPENADPLITNGTRNMNEQFVDVMTFMMQEPLCMWTLINISYCCLALFGFLVQRAVFGQLRVAEAQRVKDKFWNYVFYKFIFVFGVINVQYMDEVLLWCSWFTLIGFLHLLGQLCKDRFEYLSSSPNTARWAHVRLVCLLTGILASSAMLFVAAVVWGLPAGRDTFAFMAAECVLVGVTAVHVCARYALQLYEADVAGPLAYYTHLGFDAVSLVVEAAHVVHMVVYSNMLVSMASLVLLMQLRHLLHELQARLRRHRLYTSLATHMSRNYPMASKEEVDKNQDNCAICWEPMKEARKLPCSHLFHNSCLCQWVQQDASCPTCRRALAATPPLVAPAAPAAPAAPLAPAPAAPAPHLPLPNHLFHFDGSRYVSWLPSFSVEVTRVRADVDALTVAQIHAMAEQVVQMFPQFSIDAVTADLTITRSMELTLEGILDGRLLPEVEPERDLEFEPDSDPESERVEQPRPTVPPPAPQAAASASTSTENISELSLEADPASNHFSGSAAEREALLQRRKERLIATARRRYLQRAPATESAIATATEPAITTATEPAITTGTEPAITTESAMEPARS